MPRTVCLTPLQAWRGRVNIGVCATFEVEHDDSHAADEDDDGEDTHGFFLMRSFPELPGGRVS